MPLSYVLDQLAQRWHVDPERLERMRPDTILRGLALMRLESSVVVKKHAGPSKR